MRVGAVSPAVSWFACPSPTLATGVVPISLTGRYPHRFALAGRVKALVLRTNTAEDCLASRYCYRRTAILMRVGAPFPFGLFMSRGASATKPTRLRTVFFPRHPL